MEYQRGMKTMTLPAHRYEGCRDIQVKCIQFVVPEDISENGEPEHAMCAPEVQGALHCPYHRYRLPLL